MLKRWLEAFQGDVFKFLTALDVEINEAEAELALKELIVIGRIKPMEACKNVELTALGLKRDLQADGMLTPEQSLYWRVVLQHLAEVSTSKGVSSAQSVGQAREIAVAEVGEMIEAMEVALPTTAIDLLNIVNAHAKKDSGKFVARQLLPLLQCVDLNDGSIRRGAINLVAEHLREEPRVNSHGSSYACGGDGKWESALIDIARLVANDSTEFAGLILDTADSLQMMGTAESLTQALFIAGSLLERVTKRLPSVAAEAVMDSLIRPAVTHSTTAVRRESMRVLGLLLSSQGVITPDAVVILRTALSADAAPVRCMAARALGDAALLHGPAALDKYRIMVDPEDENVTEADFNASLPLEMAFMKCLDEEGKPFDFKSDAYELDDIDVEDVAATKAAAAVEAEESVGTVAAESLCKIILRRGEGAFDAAAGIVARLLGSYFAADAQKRPRLAQCLAVFFPALASAPEDRRRLLADCALPALRSAAKVKGLSRVAALLVQLLTASEEATSNGADLALALATESLAVSTKQMPTGSQATLAKAYVNSIARVLALLPVKSAKDETDPSDRVELNDTLTKAWHAAVLAAERTKEKAAAKDLVAAAERLRIHCYAPSQPLSKEGDEIAVPVDEDDLTTQLDDDVREAVLEHASELANSSEVPFAGPKAKDAKVKTVAAVPTRESRSRASKTAAAGKLVDDDLKKPLPKVTPEKRRGSRRGALLDAN
jgi:condensin complex subunit 3